MVGSSLLAILSPALYKSLVLVPGTALLLGEHNAWSFLTTHLVSHSLTLLALHVSLVYFLGLRVEAPGGPHPLSRVAATLAVSLSAAGLLVYCVRLALFMGSADEDFLYKPASGCAPVAAVVGVLAAEVFGDAPLHAALALPVSQVPLCVLLLSGAMQNYGVTSDATATLVAALVAWAYLRFFTAHAGVGAPAGDARDEFELLTFVPGPFRVALRPLEKMGSALFLPVLLRVAGAVAGEAGLAATVAQGGAPPPCPYASGAAAAALVASPLFGEGGAGGGGGGGGLAGGASALARSIGGLDVGGRDPYGAGGGSPAGVTSSDPVADRRRIKALASLDKRLEEMKAMIKVGGYSGVAGAWTGASDAGKAAAGGDAAAGPSTV
jgi:hypothetical protein